MSKRWPDGVITSSRSPRRRSGWGISSTTFYALVKERELSLVKIGHRPFVTRKNSTISSGEGASVLDLYVWTWQRGFSRSTP
jgi:hypothetical protein